MYLEFLIIFKLLLHTQRETNRVQSQNNNKTGIILKKDFVLFYSSFGSISSWINIGQYIVFVLTVYSFNKYFASFVYINDVWSVPG